MCRELIIGDVDELYSKGSHPSRNDETVNRVMILKHIQEMHVKTLQVLAVTSITLIAGEVNKSSDSTEEVYCVRRNFYVKTENIKRSRVSVTQAQCITLT